MTAPLEGDQGVQRFPNARGAVTRNFVRNAPPRRLAAAEAGEIKGVSTWTKVDEPVLRWLREEGSSFLPQAWGLELGLRGSAEPSEEIEGLTTEQEDQALTRLLEYGLIDGERGETTAFAHWLGLRVTGRGMQVLGEWPDLDQLAGAVGLKLLLNELAVHAPDTEDQSALRRLIGIIGEVGEGTALSTLNSAAAELGDEASGG